jgi:hypothetical protein
MAHHGYCDSLSRYYDMAALIRQAGNEFDWQGLLARASAWKVTLPVRWMLVEIEKNWSGVVPLQLLQEVQKLRGGWRERWIDWGLRKARNKEAASILLAVWNTPGVGWRLRFLMETAFPGERYLRHYFGEAPGKLCCLLYLRRLARFLGRVRRAGPEDRDAARVDLADKEVRIAGRVDPADKEVRIAGRVDSADK